MQFSKKIKICRQKNKLTQEKFAQSLNVSRKTVSGWENGRSFPDITTLLKISDMYHVSLDDLMKESSGAEDYYQTQIKNGIRAQKKSTFLYLLLLVSFIFLFIQFLTNWKIPYHLVIIILLICLISYLVSYSNGYEFHSLKYLFKFFSYFIVFFVLNSILFVATGNLAITQNMYWNFGIIIGAIFLDFLLSITLTTLILFIPETIKSKLR
ncbi:helix-turn-helix domain-containing protein [Companilactobacillus kimchii]|uniref:HTH cro/C1-type domain-containing protein n=2 Tax=Companilactobacillus kimchii TaxID=2801452 RepID=A0ABR5NWI5_9LACO|nr:helix-turn-helix transcriptional regulator [Companilactobacillus kimchii]GEO46408.1 transcriptional regulator [Companilactobacillus paralimentarius]KAE9559489.1 hypothetical protein ATN91_11015 [Companilactobacillus kimchii]KAE9559796.1 hypothetical protein ATN91_09860 [Companilactobacillus kimchii]KRK53302.1 hypothetical protein FC97_GL000021 [Companilactobacillus kimchii DSM 13961 = JCM 10707]OWF33329.1 hypothetical protein LKACC12383_00934 [Companilactobacillus kimchii]